MPPALLILGLFPAGAKEPIVIHNAVLKVDIWRVECNFIWDFNSSL